MRYKELEDTKKLWNGLVFADFQKAFDLVNHEILIEKLRIYGLEDNSLSWFSLSFLCLSTYWQCKLAKSVQ